MTGNDQLVINFLSHHGVKGQKWGVRKERDSAGSSSSTAKTPIKPLVSAATINPDGSIDIKKGGQLQRVVRNSDGMMFKSGVDIGDEVTYASFSKRDNATYEHMLGKKKGLLTKEPSEVLTLTAKQDLKSPSPKDTSVLFFKALKKNPEAFAELNDRLKDTSSLGWSKVHLKEAMDHPDAARSFDLYAFAFDSGNYLKSPSVANKKFLDEVQKAGYNMLLDPSDSMMGITDTPVIILGGRKHIEVTSRRTVDKQSKKFANQTLKEVEKEITDGRTFLEKLGYEI